MSDRPAIYLDHAATSWPKPHDVADAVARMFDRLTANAGRSGHAPAVASARMVFETREAAARLVGAKRSDDLIFTRGATEAINLILKGFLKPGDRVFLSPLEHNAVMRPLERLRRERGIEWNALPADAFGRIDTAALRAVEGLPRAALIVLAHASNVNGAVQDVPAVRRAAPGAAILLDAAQTAGILPIDVAAWGVDFLALSAHKGLLGPTGVGLCYLSPEREVAPLIEGGTGSRSGEFDMPEQRPDRYEAGTLNLHGIAGLGGALGGLASRGLLGDAKRRLTSRLIDGLAGLPGLRVLSPADGSALLAAFVIEGATPDTVARALEERHGILCRPGLHCSPAAHRHLGTHPTGAVRLSPGWGNTDDEIDRAIEAVARLARDTGRG